MLLVGRSRDRFPAVSLGIFSVVPPTEPYALRSTQPMKVITRCFSWGKGGQCVWLMTYHPCSAKMSRKSRALTYPEPLGPPRPVAGNLYFTFARWGWVINATPRPLYPQGRPGTHCGEGWVGPRADLYRCGKSCPRRDSIPGPSSL